MPKKPKAEVKLKDAPKEVKKAVKGGSTKKEQK